MGRRIYALRVLITSGASVLCLAVQAFPAGVTLRYIYKPGQELVYTFTDDVSSTVQVGTDTQTTEYKQHTSGTIRKTTVSVAGGNGVVEESPVKGVMERTDRRGTTSQALTAQVRRYTFTTRGQLVKTERLLPDGRVDSAPQALDGFSFTLPEKAVTAGAAWSDTLQVVGLDGKPVTVKATSTYRGAKQRQGRLTDQVDVTFKGEFVAPAPGTLAGTVTYYLARDLGQEVETSSNLTITTSITVPIEGKPRDARRILRFSQARTLAK